MRRWSFLVAYLPESEENDEFDAEEFRQWIDRSQQPLRAVVKVDQTVKCNPL
jgi:hypothetical protein